jgi:hypothetical protein
MRVVVYKNLNLGNWSVCECKSARTYGRKLRGVDSITLANVSFVVQPAAQKKVFDGAARTVHAWANGDVIDISVTDGLLDDARRVSYNPRRCGFFHLADGSRVDAAKYVIFTSNGRAYAVDPR